MANNRLIRAWLLTGVFMVLVQVAIGGITRLTDSGLSMTSWEPVQGSLPPLTEEAWQAAFEDYRQYPEFYQKNADFTLAEFKSIFWWEYIHRNWARLIGLVFAVPFVFFLAKGWLSRRQIGSLVGVMLLGLAQAVMGWYMVQSGMVDQPWVSPYRLTAHLFLALAIFAWLYRIVLGLDRTHIARPTPVISGLGRVLWLLTALVLVQIAYGGLVAGSEAARHFNTWPTMNGQWIPDGLFHRGLEWDAVRENRLTSFFIVNVQFIHRTLAWVVLALAVWAWWKTRASDARTLLHGGRWLMVAVAGQAVLGISTLVLSSPQQIHVQLGVAHQLWAFVLVGSLIYLHVRNRQESIQQA